MTRFVWGNIPRPLQRLIRWGVYNADTKEVGFQPGSKTRFKANDLSTAMTFDKARSYAEKLGPMYGPMFFVSADYVVLDFDYTEDVVKLAEKLGISEVEAEAVRQQHYKMLKDMPTWTERSSSGTGYHAVYAVGAGGSATTKIADLNIDVRGNNSLLFMTGDVVNENANAFSLAGSMISALLESAIERRDFITTAVQWCDETISDSDLFELFKAQRVEQYRFLTTKQDQTGIGDQRFAALKDLIVRSMNYQQVERIYLSAPCCHIDYASKNRGSTDKSEYGYKNFLRREIERAALELVKSDQFHLMVQAQLECPLTPANGNRLAISVKEIEATFPMLTGVGAKAQASLDLIKGCSTELSTMSTLALLATACGQNYVTRGLNQKGLNNSQSFVQLDFFVVTGSGQGKSSAIERLAKIHNHVPDSFNALKFWLNPERFVQYVPKSISAQSLHNKISRRPDGAILHLDEIGMMLAAVSAMGGFEGYVNSVNNAREVGGLLSAPEYTDSNKMLPGVKEPAVSIIATGVPSNTAIQLRTNNRIESGYLSRHLMMVLMEEDEAPVIDLAGFAFDVTEDPTINLDFEWLEWMETVIAKRDKPVMVGWDPAVMPLIPRVFEVAQFDPADPKTIPFNRYSEYTVKLSALQAIIANPFHPKHTVETLTWALEFTEAARRSAHAWFRRSLSTGTVKLSEREDVDPATLYGRIHAMVSRIVTDKREGNQAHQKITEYLTKQNRVKLVEALNEHEAIAVSYLKMRKNSLGLSKAGSRINEYLEHAIKEGVEDRRLKVVMIDGVKCVQALA